MDKYNVLVIGSGGREHTLAWKISDSKLLGELYCAPGNPGTAQLAQNVGIDTSDFDQISDFCSRKSIDVVLVGPEVPLVNGLADHLKEKNIPVFGPRKSAAILEGSKEFAKDFMKRHEIPTADYAVFSADDFDDAFSFIQTKDSYPIVLKADGLAGGKGVFICKSEDEAKERLEKIKDDSKLGEAADRLVVEEFMDGEEASVFVLTDGHTSHIIHNAQDHKRIGEGDTGLNTGGMGAYCPAPVLTQNVLHRIKVEIIERTIAGMQLEERDYEGILYVGLMITKDGPKVVEYNCRFGDPECQVILPSLENDLLDLIIATTEQRLDEKSIQIDDKYRCCVVLASEGYPVANEKGKKINGLKHVDDKCIVFHAGTIEKEGSIYTNGGRVLNVVGSGETLQKAIDHTYKNVEKIDFDGCYFRRDIGKKGLLRLS